jgi:hypothetical protein
VQVQIQSHADGCSRRSKIRSQRSTQRRAWTVPPSGMKRCVVIKNKIQGHFGVTYCLHLQGRTPSHVTARKKHASSELQFLSLCLSSGILETRKNTEFRKLDLFLSSGEEGRTPTLLGPLERANLNHWPTPVRLPPPSLEDGNRSSFRNAVLYSF